MKIIFKIERYFGWALKNIYYYLCVCICVWVSWKPEKVCVGYSRVVVTSSYEPPIRNTRN